MQFEWGAQGGGNHGVEDGHHCAGVGFAAAEVEGGAGCDGQAESVNGDDGRRAGGAFQQEAGMGAAGVLGGQHVDVAGEG
ncbi:hypothetical protein ADL03_40675, partial [Nocardia sp. NRRL S-836]